MRVSVRPEGLVTITGRSGRKNKVLLHLVLQSLSERDARRLERSCNSSSSRPVDMHQLHLTWNSESLIELYFRKDNRAGGLRVLEGETILQVMNNRAPRDIGDFGPILYERAEKRLRAAGKLSEAVHGYAALEALFLDAVTRELPIFFANWTAMRRPFSESDSAFIHVMTRNLAEMPAPQVDGGEVSSIHSISSIRSIRSINGGSAPFVKAIQLGLPLEEGELLDRLTARVRSMTGVCNEPLIHSHHAAREAKPPAATQSPAAVKKSISRRGKEDGYFVAFTGESRPIPLLNQHTIYGLAKADDVLSPGHHFTKEDFRRLAKAAADHRCKSGVGGPLIADESAELYVRILRGMLLTEEELSNLSCDELCSLTRLAAQLHRLEAPSEKVVAVH